MTTCRKCGREGKAQFSGDYEPGAYCSNFSACKKRAAKRAKTAAVPR